MQENTVKQGKPISREKLYSICTKVLFPLILFLYPLRHIHVGVEWWDTGYNYGNFVYMDRMDPMWVFSTYLGNALGNLFTRLPFGNYMMGLNVYTGLTVSFLGIMGYLFFTRKIKLPEWIVFLGEFVAISLCWCPTALLYNYLTYVLMAGGVMALYVGLYEEKNKYLVIAGVCLGVNVFVRFPNLAEMALILAVWAYGFIKKRKFGYVVKQTMWCVLGYVLGMGVILGYLTVRYGLDEYISAIVRLLSMPSEASDYTITSMVIYQLQNYRQNLIWLRYLAFFVMLGILGFLVWPKKYKRIAQIGYVACVFVGFYYLMMKKNMFNMKYSTKPSAFQWAVFLLTATIIAGVITIFRKKATEQEKLLSGLGILVILITPLGSNNHLYSSINNLFLVAPFTLYQLYLFLKWLPQQVSLRKVSGISLSMFPVKAMILSMLFMLGVQSLGFGIVYVFSESDGGENLHTKIENSDILKGMYTSPDRAKVLGELCQYVKEQGLTGREVILYGQIPALSYYLEMPFAITSWPELRSYNYEVMVSDLEALTDGIEVGAEQPVIIMEAGCLSPDAGEDRKYALLMEWADQYEYVITFENEKFAVLQVQP